MAIATEPQKTSSIEKLAALQERLSVEMQRHAAEVEAIQREMQNATRQETRFLIEGDQEAPAGGIKTDESATKQKSELNDEQKEMLLTALQKRLSKEADHYTRPEGINFADVRRTLEANPAALWSLSKMEETGGAPDIVAVEDDVFVFADCSEESPAGRRNCVYDKAAEVFVDGTFNGNAVTMAEEFGVEMWSPEFYWEMQKSGKFDRRTWSWLKTDAETRKTGGARCGDRLGVLVGVLQDDARGRNDFRAWRGLLRVQKA